MNDLALYRGARVLVFGASGFIGRWVASALHVAGAELSIAVRDPVAASDVMQALEVACDVRVVDLATSGEAGMLVRRLRPSIVFNLAGYGVDRAERATPLSHRINCDLVAELADAVEPDARWTGQALVHAGSALEFGTMSGDFSDPWGCAPTTLYGRTKLEGSLRLREISAARGVKAVSARLFTIYGSGEHAARLLPSLIVAAARSGAIPLTSGAQRRDFTYVEDAAAGLLRIGACGAPFKARALNLATGQLVSVREFVESAAHALGIASKRLEFGALPTRPEEMQHDPVSIEALLAATGWKPPTTLETGLRRTIALERHRASMQ